LTNIGKYAMGRTFVRYNLKPLDNDVTGVLCLDCGWTRISWSQHDYRTCPCPNQVMVDGGRDYLRYGAKDMNRIQLIKITPMEFVKDEPK
jgi:hypothetical protein